MVLPGKLITFEGGEAVGKSTQVQLIAAAFRNAGMDVIITREPGGTEFAEKIRKMILDGDGQLHDVVVECLLLYAARRDHVLSIIQPALLEGKWVLCDRFMDSTMAYQGIARRMGKDSVQAIHKVTLGNFAPDLTIILDVPPELAIRRLKDRGAPIDKMEQMYESMHKVVRGAFLDIAGANPQRCRLIDASGDSASVAQRIKIAIASKLGIVLE